LTNHAKVTYCKKYQLKNKKKRQAEIAILIKLSRVHMHFIFREVAKSLNTCTTKATASQATKAGVIRKILEGKIGVGHCQNKQLCRAVHPAGGKSLPFDSFRESETRGTSGQG
jgi:hypothetical protein